MLALVKLHDKKLEQFKKDFNINCYSVIMDGIPTFKIKKEDIIDYIDN